MTITQTTQHSNPNICFKCKQPPQQTPLKQCGSCKIALYCNAACQKADWSLHKSLCQRLQTIPKHLFQKPPSLDTPLPIEVQGTETPLRTIGDFQKEKGFILSKDAILRVDTIRKAVLNQNQTFLDLVCSETISDPQKLANPPKLFFKKDPTRGLCLHAKEAIGSDQFIVKMGGELFPFRPNTYRNLCYATAQNDCTTYAGIGSFANDGFPNAVILPINHGEEALFSSRPIQNGEEITCSYGLNHSILKGSHEITEDNYEKMKVALKESSLRNNLYPIAQPKLLVRLLFDQVISIKEVEEVLAALKRGEITEQVNSIIPEFIEALVRNYPNLTPEIIDQIRTFIPYITVDSVPLLFIFVERNKIIWNSANVAQLIKMCEVHDQIQLIQKGTTISTYEIVEDPYPKVEVDTNNFVQKLIKIAHPMMYLYLLKLISLYSKQPWPKERFLDQPTPAEKFQQILHELEKKVFSIN